jgi:hypothetical protein
MVSGASFVASLTGKGVLYRTQSDLRRFEQADYNQNECPGNKDTREQHLKIQVKTLKPVSEGI